MNEKQVTNKISLWIKQRLFISRNYQQTMNDLETFVTEMKKLEEINANEKQQESENKILDDEERRLSLILPPLIGIKCFFFFLRPKSLPFPFKEVPKKIEENTTTNYRQWKINDLTDDDDDEEKKPPIENRGEQKKSMAFEKFMARRPISMPRVIQEQNQLTDDEDTHEQITITKSQMSNLNLKRSQAVPILSQKISSVRPRQVIDLTDDDDDFVPSQAGKKLKAT